MLTTLPIDQTWIAAHIPHQGNMCLIDHVTKWDEQSITCHAISHQQAANPLRHREQLSTACGIEYAAQAMAVHGALLAPEGQQRPRAGFLVSVRGATIYRDRLDNIEQALTIKADLVNSSEDNMLYAFTIYADNSLLLDGRAAVMLNTESLLGKFT
jgi:predicted hotdog family 3-hydroxylacyl-ACP dehydratase